MVFAALVAAGAPALAQCPDPVDEVLVFPADGATDVPRNVVLRAEFPRSRDPHAAPVWRVLDDRGRRVSGTEAFDGVTSTFTPDEPFEARRTYTARVTAEQSGSYWDVAFLTGSGTDGAPPSFAGLSSITWREEGEPWLLSNCRLARGDGLVFTLGVPEPTDDSGRDDLCYYVYETSGPSAGAEPIARLRPDGDGQIQLLHPLSEGDGEFCFRVEVRDLVGRFDGNRRERCVEAVAGAIYGDLCSAASPGAAPSGDAGLALAVICVGVGLALRRRRR